MGENIFICIFFLLIHSIQYYDAHTTTTALTLVCITALASHSSTAPIPAHTDVHEDDQNEQNQDGRLNEGGDYEEQKPWGCSCTLFINAAGYGDCKAEHPTDGVICYVNRPSNCGDLKQSITNRGKLTSASACQSRTKVSGRSGSAIDADAVTAPAPLAREAVNAPPPDVREADPKEWSEWRACSKTCGEGKRRRNCKVDWSKCPPSAMCSCTGMETCNLGSCETTTPAPTTTPSPAPEGTCYNLTSTDVALQSVPGIFGTYKKKDITRNNYPVYEKIGSTNNLYLVMHSGGYWVISKTNTGQGLQAQYATRYASFRDGGYWWYALKKKWKGDDPTIRMEPCKGTCYKFTSTDVALQSLPGIFGTYNRNLHPIYRNLHPVYEKIGSTNNMYLLMHSSGYWVISNTNPAHLLYAQYTTKYGSFDDGGRWFYSYKKKWKKDDPTIRMEPCKLRENEHDVGDTNDYGHKVWEAKWFNKVAIQPGDEGDDGDGQPSSTNIEIPPLSVTVSGALGEGREFIWGSVDYIGQISNVVDRSRCCEKCRANEDYADTKLIEFNTVTKRCWCVKSTQGKQPSTEEKQHHFADVCDKLPGH